MRVRTDIGNSESEGITVSEAIRISGIGRSKMYELVWTDKIPHFHVGSAIRIIRSGLYEFMHSHTHRKKGGVMSDSRLQRLP